LININSKLDWADILLCGQGLIMYEAALKRLPCICFQNIDKSKSIVTRNFIKLKTCLFISSSQFNMKNIKINFLKLYENYNLRKKISKNGKKIDIYGANRISNFIEKFY